MTQKETGKGKGDERRTPKYDLGIGYPPSKIRLNPTTL